jgi:DUF4097 and DUF4098 domain-containing protein YvlB
MKIMLRLGVSAFALVVLAGCHHSGSSGGYSSADYRYTTNVVRQGEISGSLRALEVDNRFGPVRVVGTDAPAGDWSWTLTVRARDEESAREAAAADLLVRTDSDRLRLALSLPDSDGRWQFQSELEIRVPKSLTVRTENRFGATEIAGITGNMEPRGQNGAVEIREVAGKVRAETAFAPLIVRDVGPATLRNRNGRIEVAGVQGALDAETSFTSLTVEDVRGPVKLRNQNGRVEAVGATGADISTSFAELTVREIGGDVTLANRNGRVSGSTINGSVQAETSFASLDIAADAPSVICRNQNGSIQLHALSGSLTNLQAQTSFARLDVQLPGGLKPLVEARTSHGNIESDFPVLLNPPGADPFASAEPGTPRVSLRNQNGSIRVSRN